MVRGERREAKRLRARYGMQVRGRSVQKLQQLSTAKATDPSLVTWPNSRKKRRSKSA